MWPWQNYHNGYEGKAWHTTQKSLPDKMQACSSSYILKHGKQVLLVHRLPCRNHIYLTWEEDTNLPHLWHRSHGKAFFGDRLCLPSAAAQLWPWGVQAEGLSEFFNGADNKMLAWKQPRESWQQYLHPHKTQAKENSKTDRTWCLLWSPPSHLRLGLLSKPLKCLQGNKTQIQKGIKV